MFCKRFFEIGLSRVIGCAEVVFVESMTHWSIGFASIVVITVVDFAVYLINGVSSFAAPFRK